MRRSQGFTLVELLVAIGILALVTGTLTLIVYHFVTIPRWGNARMTVDGALRNAGVWLRRDGNQSEAFVPGGSCGTFETAHGPTFEYALTGDTLYRVEGGQTQVVARHIDTITCSANGNVVTVTLVASEGDVTDNATYQVVMRAY